MSAAVANSRVERAVAGEGKGGVGCHEVDGVSHGVQGDVGVGAAVAVAAVPTVQVVEEGGEARHFFCGDIQGGCQSRGGERHGVSFGAGVDCIVCWELGVCHLTRC